jgi:hypothetical protein
MLGVFKIRGMRAIANSQAFVAKPPDLREARETFQRACRGCPTKADGCGNTFPCNSKRGLWKYKCPVPTCPRHTKGYGTSPKRRYHVRKQHPDRLAEFGIAPYNATPQRPGRRTCGTITSGPGYLISYFNLLCSQQVTAKTSFFPRNIPGCVQAGLARPHGPG